MDTQTTQTFGNENKKDQSDNKENKWARAAKAAGATAAVAGVAGVAASFMEGEMENVSVPESEDIMAQTELNENLVDHDAMIDQASSSTAPTMSAEPVSNIPQSAQHYVEPQTNVHTVPPVQHVSESQSIASEVEHTSLSETQDTLADEQGIPVDAQWLANDSETTESAESADSDYLTAQSASGTLGELNQQMPPISQSAMNIIHNSVGDDLADNVNVSPEIFMSMMGLKPTDMIQTEYNGDGQAHMAALLANDNGQYLLLVDSDGDGFLDTLTDMTGHEYSMLEDGIHFEVNVDEMTAFVEEINPDAFVETPLYAQNNDIEVTSIEGDGDGEDMAYIDEHDITDVPSMDDAMTDDDLETTEVVIDDDLDELDLAEDLAINDDLNDIDLIGFDDSSLA